MTIIGLRERNFVDSTTPLVVRSDYWEGCVTAETTSTSTIMYAETVVAEHVDLVSEVARASAGRVIETVGERTVLAFESASAAVSAAVAMQQAVAISFQPWPLRIGLATGDVVWTDDGCTGAPVGTAALLFARADPGQILVNNVVRWLAAHPVGGSYVDLGTTEIDGVDGAVEVFAVAWQPLSPRAEAEVTGDQPFVALPAALASPARQRLVGRESEWSTLADAWERVEAGAREVVLISGAARGQGAPGTQLPDRRRLSTFASSRSNR